MVGWKPFWPGIRPRELTLTPGTDDREVAEGWLKDGKLEGVVAKRIDGPYLEGERAMIKVKRARTADCVVGGFRYASDAPVVGSLLLGLYDDEGRLNHVGHTSGFAGIDKAALTRELEGLRGGEGFTGRAPGGPSRWSTDDRRMGAAPSRDWSSRSRSTRSPTTASGTAPDWSAAAPTRRQGSAGWSSSAVSLNGTRREREVLIR